MRVKILLIKIVHKSVPKYFCEQPPSEYTKNSNCSSQITAHSYTQLKFANLFAAYNDFRPCNLVAQTHFFYFTESMFTIRQSFSTWLLFNFTSFSGSAP